jgi:hypothetical protein
LNVRPLRSRNYRRGTLLFSVSLGNCRMIRSLNPRCNQYRSLSFIVDKARYLSAVAVAQKSMCFWCETRSAALARTRAFGTSRCQSPLKQRPIARLPRLAAASSLLITATMNTTSAICRRIVDPRKYGEHPAELDVGATCTFLNVAILRRKSRRDG